VDDYTPEWDRAGGSHRRGGDGIARVTGLPGAAVNEILEFQNGTEGLALNLDEETIGRSSWATTPARGGAAGQGHRWILSVRVGDACSAGWSTGLGEPARRQGPHRQHETRRLEVQAPGIGPPAAVSEPLQTGIKAISTP